MRKVNSFMEELMENFEKELPSEICKTDAAEEICLASTLETIHLKAKTLTIHVDASQDVQAFQAKDDVVVHCLSPVNKYAFYGRIKEMIHTEKETYFTIVFTTVKRIFQKKAKKAILPRYQIKVVTKRSPKTK